MKIEITMTIWLLLIKKKRESVIPDSQVYYIIMAESIVWYSEVGLDIKDVSSLEF